MVIKNCAQFVLIIGIGLSLSSGLSQTADVSGSGKSSANNTMKVKNPQITYQGIVIYALIVTSIPLLYMYSPDLFVGGMKLGITSLGINLAAKLGFERTVLAWPYVYRKTNVQQVNILRIV